MRSFRVPLIFALASALAISAQAPKRILFDHTRHEEAGTSAEWVICSASEPDPSPAAPASEADWNGGISAWAFDLYQAGYKVQSLPPSGRLTYGDATNAQDLSNYAVYILPEPYLKFTAAEKQAILAFVQNGGGLFLVGNHPGSARYSGTGGTDAYTAFNDLVAVNGTNPYGFTFVPGHGPGDSLADTTSTAFSTGTSPAEQAILHGAYGSLGLMDFHSYSYLTVNTAQNPSVREILRTQVSGDTGSFIVTCTLGNGRVVAISDSAPTDDGTTTTSGKALHNSYTINSNRAFFLNATAYLAGDSGPAAPTPVVGIATPASNVSLAAGGSVSFQGTASISDGSALSYGWAFGDGATAAVLGPISHAYGTAGTYTATFTATSNQGKSASATRTITVTSATGSSLKETFDTGDKAAYATGTVALPTGTWTLNDALLGDTASDRKVGAQSVRARNSAKVTMNFNFAGGAKTVTVKHAKYGTDDPSTWGLWYSTNGGGAWTQAGTAVSTTSTTLATATFTVNVAAPIRFELRKTDGSSNRVNFDDVTITGY
ncbi:PKD domain-containing protein [Geothrix sp. 21YS21S-4]|uniref:PKD domain-containing protein n=1 Tax=Geothrix sp. 21YS21S-4 TaxID=3068889 RepID=UPI0027BA9384|nr:DUF4350 domain-containing protein [Geothrix sp. 21YS21S-4]